MISVVTRRENWLDRDVLEPHFRQFEKHCANYTLNAGPGIGTAQNGYVHQQMPSPAFAGIN
jgi:hypothetical protein